MADMVKLDIEYTDRRSVWLNLSILLRTIPVVLFARGAS
jgi:lipopolysaccharide/colanic/teichoic acid biosynthesis glycosyltransferase